MAVMESFLVKYPTSTVNIKIGGKTFVVEAIRDLDEAIDLICQAISLSETKDPFAEDLCPYFGVLWPSGQAISQYLFEHSDIVKNKSVLELGCGLGLPSLVVSHLGGRVLATDFHPDVEKYFFRNCRHSSINCDYKRLNWREDFSTVGAFDVVIGSDVLYESKHPRELASGLLKFVKPKGTIILSDPGRAYLQAFIKAMNFYGIEEEMSFETVEGKDIFILKFVV
jgi:predicted nicotinamide N-methyase